MASTKSVLSSCINPLNCVLIQKEFKNPEKAFNQLKEIAEKIPRTSVLENSNNYWKGICRSLIFRFPDELEILKVNGSKGIIQIKSASRFGSSDLGVNQRRIRYLFKKLENEND